MIEAIQQYFFTCMLNILTAVYILNKLLKVSNLFNMKTFLMIIIMIFLSILNFVYVDNFVRFPISTLYSIVCARVIFDEKLHKVTTAVIIQQVILFISELIYALFVIFIFDIVNLNSSETIIGALIPNILICIFAILLINAKIVLNFSNKIIDYMEKIKQKNKYFIAFVLMITLNILLVVMYINSNNLMLVVINAIFIMIYSYIVYLLLNEKNQNIKFKEENKLLLDNLNEYEKMLDYQRVANHENKNQLLVIKSIASKNNKKLHNYLDEVIKEKREDDESLYNGAKRIPSGGLQGLVYQKMLIMKERNIILGLDVSKEVRKIELSKFNSKINFDLCRAIGIIIDNAIDEVSKLKQKELSISMYKDDNHFIIEIANKYKVLPDMERLDENGYTTKENGHGYGLCLLKDICEKNKDIENERKIIENIFIQIIKVKI